MAALVVSPTAQTAPPPPAPPTDKEVTYEAWDDFVKGGNLPDPSRGAADDHEYCIDKLKGEPLTRCLKNCQAENVLQGGKKKDFPVGGLKAAQIARIQKWYRNYSAWQKELETAAKAVEEGKNALEELKNGERQAPLTNNEMVRLMCIVCDHTLEADLNKYAMMQASRQELDGKMQCTFASVIFKKFMDPNYIALLPGAFDKQDLFPSIVALNLDPNVWDESRTCSFLLSHYNKAKTALTIATAKYISSGEGDKDFSDFCNGDIRTYIWRKMADENRVDINWVLRLVPDEAGFEMGFGEGSSGCGATGEIDYEKLGAALKGEKTEDEVANTKAETNALNAQAISFAAQTTQQLAATLSALSALPKSDENDALIKQAQNAIGQKLAAMMG